MSTQLQDIATQAKMDSKRRFRSLYRLLNKENLATTFKKLRNKRSAVGIDGQTYAKFENCLAENCQSLEDALKEKRYSAPAIRRVNIPKPDGRTRPLGITTISDKVVQAPASAILSALYGSQFKEFNFGYRPKLGRTKHWTTCDMASPVRWGGSSRWTSNPSSTISTMTG